MLGIQISTNTICRLAYTFIGRALRQARRRTTLTAELRRKSPMVSNYFIACSFLPIPYPLTTAKKLIFAQPPSPATQPRHLRPVRSRVRYHYQRAVSINHHNLRSERGASISASKFLTSHIHGITVARLLKVSPACSTYIIRFTL